MNNAPKKFKCSNRSDIAMFRALDMMREVNERAAAGENIMRMGAGQPCFGAPEEALDYARATITSDPRQGYTEAVGMLSLRERIAQHYEEYYGAKANPANMVISVGSSGGFLLVFLAAFDAGDKIAITTPTYPAYRNILQTMNLQVVEIETLAKDNYQPTVELLENCGQEFDGLIINSPSNPAGTMLSDNELEKICNWCDEKGIRLISDEAYHGITYGKKAQTALKYSDNVIVLNTFSKYFAMTGWRLGWVSVPADLQDRMKKLAESLFVSPPTISQNLAYKIFDHMDVLDSYVAYYHKNRDILMTELPKAGFKNFTNASGAFYVYADVHHLTNNSEDYCRRMLDEALVSTTPGVDFDVERGHQAIRICYADSTENIIEACTRLKKWQS
ncbi:MAG: aminotransferase class I/II-fold pyridoxal phosphate-dependent enzyme [Alphaproteobacteria bacterium]|nr:aminotransferase class I/II-fold pyridoxal phosphate-dependent enzyme [Alphaproteobacteria bacterium]